MRQKVVEENLGDINKIWLDRDIGPAPEGVSQLRFYPDCPDEFEDKIYYQIVYDLAERLAEGQVILYSAPYTLKKPSKWRLFGDRRPARFADQDEAPQLKAYLETSGWHDGLFAVRVFFKTRQSWGTKTWYDFKSLFILQESLDMELFQKADITYGEPSGSTVHAVIFPETKIRDYGGTAATIDYYRESEDYIIKLATEYYMAFTYLTLNLKYISEQQIVDYLRQVVEKYHKILEVQI